MRPEAECSGVTITYTKEEGSWLGTSRQLPSLFAGGATFTEARDLAQQAVQDICGEQTTILQMRLA